jgi:hypothetical protein
MPSLIMTITFLGVGLIGGQRGRAGGQREAGEDGGEATTAASAHLALLACLR